MDKQNVTLSLPRTLVKRAKRLAVEEEKSFNELVRQCLEQRLNVSTGYTEARVRQLELLESGFDLGTRGKVSVTREEIYDRQ